MSDSQVDLFVHQEGVPPKHVRADGGEPLADALRRAGVEVQADLLVFAGQPASGPTETGPETDDAEDAHEPVDPAATVAGLVIGRSGHVHCHKCRRVAVTVHYQQHNARRRFSPARTVAAVTAWARHRFHLTDADAENLVLQVCDSDRRPRPDEHLGELVHAPDCRLCFDLVPDHKIEG